MNRTRPANFNPHRLLLGAMGICVGLQAACQASVTRGEPRSGSPARTAFAAVGELNIGNRPCTSVAILDGSFALTARHCATSSGQIAGTLVNPAEVQLTFGGEAYQATALFADFDADLVMIHLDRRVPDAFDLWDPTLGEETNQLFKSLGYGGTDEDGNGRWDASSDGMLRTFQNVFDEVRVDTLVGQGEVLRYDFDLSRQTIPGDLEGLHGPGDSGSPALIAMGNELRLAGIASSSGDPIDGASGSFVRVAAYRNEILQIARAVPEPSTVLLALLAFGITLRSRWPKQCHWSSN